MNCPVYDILDELNDMLENPDRIIYRGGFSIDNSSITIDIIGNKFIKVLQNELS